MYKIQEDLEHWQNLQPPLSPNSYEISLYSELTSHGIAGGNVLLLGETKSLMGFAAKTIDLHPIRGEYGDWFDIQGLYSTIIGDGVINLAGMELVDVVRPHCKRFVTRVFTKRLPGMKYATYFPTVFPDSSLNFKTQDGCRMIIWEF